MLFSGNGVHLGREPNRRQWLRSNSFHHVTHGQLLIASIIDGQRSLRPHDQHDDESLIIRGALERGGRRWIPFWTWALFYMYRIMCLFSHRGGGAGASYEVDVPDLMSES